MAQYKPFLMSEAGLHYVFAFVCIRYVEKFSSEYEKQ